MPQPELTEIMRIMVQQGRLPSGALAILEEAIREIERLKAELARREETST